jgi:hypothetical protein
LDFITVRVYDILIVVDGIVGDAREKSARSIPVYGETLDKEQRAMSKVKEKRRFTRSRVAVRVEVRLDCGVLIEGRARDVSLNGLCFETERSLPLGSHVRVRMALDGGMGEAHIECAGIVSRLDSQGVAIELDQVAAESLEHLRQLIRYNAPDAAQAEQEFEEHLGIRTLDNDSDTSLEGAVGGADKK